MNFEAMRQPGFRRTDVLKAFAELGVEPKGSTKDDLIAELEALADTGKVKPRKAKE